jgi:hypothetical protein
VFYVKLVSRPDARMVEVPLEIETELPREFEGNAVLASSGVPRKVKLRASRDALKLSTAYRADVLLADIVRTSMRGAATDLTKVQEAVQRFVRLVRERRPEGASLLVSSNGRGKIEVAEAGTGTPAAKPLPLAAPPRAAAPPTSEPPVDKLTALERRISQLEAALPQLLESSGGDGAARSEPRLSQLEEKLRAAEAQQSAVEQKIDSVQGELRASEAEVATRLGAMQQRLDSTLRAMEERLAGAAPPAAKSSEAKLLAPLSDHDGRRQTRRSTAVDAFADGLRGELRARIAAITKTAEPALEKADRAAALGAEGALSLGVPAGVAGELRALSAQVAARQQALQRVFDETDFYAAHDLPVASLLVDRLERQHIEPDPVELLRRAVQAAGSAGPVDAALLAGWLTRAATICGDELQQPLPGETVQAELHDAAPGSELKGTVVRTLAPGVRRSDGQLLRRPLIESSERSPEAAKPPPPSQPPEKADEPAAAAEAIVNPEDIGATPIEDVPGAELEELEPLGAEHEAAGKPTAAAAAAPPPAAASAPPAATARGAGDLWSDVSSDSAWESIAVGAPAAAVDHASDPWGTPAPAPAKDATHPGDPEPSKS